MALEGAELAELKDSVPPQFKPQDHDAITPAFQERTADAGAADLVANVALDLSVEQSAETPDAEDAPVVQPVNAPDAPDEDETRGDPVQAVHEQEREQTLRDLNIGMKDMADGQDDRNLDTGRIARIVSGGSENAAARREKERRRRGGDISTQLLLQQQLDNYIADLNDQIDTLDYRLDEIDQRLDEIDHEMRELDQLKDLAAKGQLDPNNPEHVQLMDKYGIAEEDIRNGTIVEKIAQASEVRSQETTGLNQEKDDLLRERGGLVKARDEAHDLKRQVEANPDDPALHQQIQELELTTEGREVSDKAALELDSVGDQAQADRAAGFDEEQVERLASATEDLDAFFGGGDTGTVADQVAETPIEAASLKPAFDEASNPQFTDVEPAQEIAVAVDNTLDKGPGATA